MTVRIPAIYFFSLVFLCFIIIFHKDQDPVEENVLIISKNISKNLVFLKYFFLVYQKAQVIIFRKVQTIFCNSTETKNDCVVSVADTRGQYHSVSESSEISPQHLINMVMANLYSKRRIQATQSFTFQDKDLNHLFAHSWLRPHFAEAFHHEAQVMLSTH